MSKLRARGDISKIQNDCDLWSVLEQVLQQSGKVRTFSVRGVRGEITLDSPLDPVSGVVDLIKSARSPRGGELALVAELSDMMKQAHETRIDNLLKSLPKADK
jgi:hypothetical protein